MNNSTQHPDPDCDEEFVIHLFLVPAVVIIMVLSFIQRRRLPLAVDLLVHAVEGRFGIVVPLEAMDSLSNRWSYGFAFGATSRLVLLQFTESYLQLSTPGWAKPFVFLLGAFELGLVCFPFFACLSTPARGVGAVLGILYTLAWLIFMLMLVINCSDGQFFGRYHNMIVSWPTILSFVFLVGRFFLILFKAVQGHRQHEVPAEGMEHKVQHVKRLLRKPPPPGRDSWFQKRFYRVDPHFRFPNRLLGTTIISLIVLYSAVLFMYVIGQHTFDCLENITSWAQENSQVVRAFMNEFLGIARKSWITASISACLTSLVYIFHILVCYRKHMKRLWRGERGFIAEKLRMNINPATSMAAIARYCGCQIAYLFWGYVITHILHYLVVLIFMYMVIVPILHGNTLEMLTNMGYSLLTLAVILALSRLQIYTVQLFFLQDKLTATANRKPLAVNNRRAFNCFSYFFFFYNVVLGFTACIMRLLTSLAVGAVLLARIDRTIMPKGHETKDLGYTWWVGMIFADHYHGNPTLVVFCNLLRTRPPKPPVDTVYELLQSDMRSRARMRWALAYTLLRNPPLILLRKRLRHSSQPAM